MSKESDEARRERLRAALRDNLKRRKAQERARAAVRAANDRPAGPDQDNG